MQISAVIITFNEEDNISSCIESIEQIVDEIIVVDSFSTDKTVEIAKRYSKVKCYSQKWLGYVEQKNYANSLTTFNTILSIDADELLSQQLKESILKLKELDENLLKVYEVSRLTNYCGSWIKHCGWYPDKKIRIFNKQSVKWQGELVHETLALLENIEIIHLKGDLLHYSYNNTSSHLQQLDKFTTLTAQEAHNKGKRTNLLELYFRPKWKFLRDYIFKLGFLDGYAGYQVCKLSATATFLKYAKLKELNNNDNTCK
jgi:glycosyltransferase involved in cell wall biosynthesis